MSMESSAPPCRRTSSRRAREGLLDERRGLSPPDGVEMRSMTASNQYCTFHLDDLFFGVEVTKVQEVIRFQEMTPVPLASEVVKGLINLRGQIVTAIDLRGRLE